MAYTDYSFRMLAEYLSIQLFRTRMGNVITEDIYIPETFNRNESLVNMVVEYFEQLGKVNLNEYEKQYIDILFASAAVQTVENANKVHMISEFEEKIKKSARKCWNIFQKF